MKLKYWMFSFMSVLMWGASSVLIRLTFGSFSALTLVTARGWLSAITLLAFCAIKKMPLPKLRDVPIFIITGAIGFSVYMVLYSMGFEVVTAATGNVILASSPIFSTLIARFVFKERIRPLGWVFTGVSFAGILILMLWDGMLSINIGVIWMLIAAILFSGYSLVQRRMTQRGYTAVQSSAYSLAGAAILMLPFMPSLVRDFSSASPRAVSVLLYLGICASGIAYVFWAKAFALAKRSADAANMLYLTPFIATLLAFIIFSETPSLGTVIGGAVILFGLWMFQKKA